MQRSVPGIVRYTMRRAGLIILIVSLPVLGCRGHVGQAHGKTTHDQARAAILELAADLAPELALLNDDPKDRAGFLESAERFVEILKRADVSHCPDDFRAQYVVSLNAWAAHAHNLRTEDTYLKGHPDEDPDYGTRQSPEEAQFLLNDYKSNQTAVQENHKLDALARAYGVQWP